jgi:hypothetical protein
LCEIAEANVCTTVREVVDRLRRASDEDEPSWGPLVEEQFGDPASELP